MIIATTCIIFYILCLLILISYNILLLKPLIRFKFNNLINDYSIEVIYDWLTINVVITVLLISRRAIFYILWYLGPTKSLFVHILRFVFIMIFLLISFNYATILMRWDLLGLVSLLLILFYPGNVRTNATFRAIVSNRVGDVCLIIILILTLNNNILTSYLIGINYYIIIRIIILVARTKRALYPFRAWLPAAMAAPTPVRTLVHSRTLVAAGVYLMIKHINNEGSPYLIIIGLLTRLIGGVGAVLHQDIKKIVALSTLRQIGLIRITIGLGYSNLASLHLLLHAYVKALLFMTVGNLIVSFASFQCSNKLNNRLLISESTNIMLLVRCLGLTGFPLINCFWSKEPIIITVFQFGWLTTLIFFISIGTTICYRINIYNITKYKYFRNLILINSNNKEVKETNIRYYLIFFPFIVIVGYIGIQLNTNNIIENNLLPINTKLIWGLFILIISIRYFRYNIILHFNYYWFRRLFLLWDTTGRLLSRLYLKISKIFYQIDLIWIEWLSSRGVLDKYYLLFIRLNKPSTC